ncbi:MAG: c-type cytochrome biogenesis protein CcmI [Vibrio sp.]
MIGFWLLSIMMVAIAFGCVAYPFFRNKRNNDPEQRDKLNAEFYHHRLHEIVAEEDAGVIDDRAVLVEELKSSLAHDVTPPELAKRKSTAKPWPVKRLLLGVFIIIAGASYSIYAYVGSYQQLAHWQSINANIEQLPAQLKSAQGQISQAQMQDLILGLRTKLYHHPEQAQGWNLLGHVAVSGQDSRIAIGALHKAYQLEPDNIRYVLDYAQVLILSSDKTAQAKGRMLLQQKLEQGAGDQRMYSLLAYDAYQHQHYAKAIEFWQKMQQSLASDDPRYASIAQNIDNATERMHNDLSVSVPVNIDFPSTLSVPEGAVLIVSVLSDDGNPMPVAAVRYSQQPFPHHVVITDDNNLVPQRRLSQQKHVIVKVRIDIDGDVSTASVNWSGQSQQLSIGDSVDISLKK